MRRTKIVCTIGPASDSQETLEALIEAGMDVARLNFSHGKHEEHARTYRRVRQAAKAVGKPLAILQDLQGPKLRTGRMTNGRIHLSPGTEVVVTTEDVLGTPERFSTDYAGLPQDVSPGQSILIDDGRLALEVLSVSERDVHTRVVYGGDLTDRKGLNLPGIRVSLPALTPKDREDAQFGMELEVDAVALSFVQDADDVREARRITGDPLGKGVPILAKIERPAAVKEIDAILEASTGVMIARGDMGVELPPQRVPIVQKQIIEAANARGRFVLTATQMLESMVNNPRPTRAEVSDVANAVFDGTDAVMLSAETAVGRWPVEAVRTMAAIIEEVESTQRYWRSGWRGFKSEVTSIQNAAAHAGVAMAQDLGLRTIVVFTESGRSASLVSLYRPEARIVAFTPNPRVQNRMAALWGVQPEAIESFDSTDDMFEAVERFLLNKGMAERGEDVVLVAGVPPGRSAATNLVKIHRVG